MLPRRLMLLVLRLVLTALLGGFLGAVLVRLAPGFGADERELDPRLTSESIRALRAERQAERNVFAYYARYLQGALRGDFGVSHSLSRPVRDLFSERAPLTLRTVVFGVALGWIAGFLFALPAMLRPAWTYDLFATFSTGLVLSVPSAVVALFFLFWGGAPPLAVAVVLFPRVFRYARNLLQHTFAMPHVAAACARGLAPARILLFHVLPLAAPQLLALLGVSFSIGFGAAIPIEVICDSPGIGQLAWIAAMGRDLPLLVNLTLFVTLATLLANSASDLAGGKLARQSA